LGNLIRTYLVPGAVFQSIVVGGGYGTGREIVQYFTRLGPYGGLYALLVAFSIFALVLSLTFEIGRRFDAYDYRAFFQILLGKRWFVYEIVGFFMLMLVFAVVIAAATSVVTDGFDLPGWIGMTLVVGLIGVLEFCGRDVVMRVLTLWSLVLYAVFMTFLVNVFDTIPEKISAAFASGGAEAGWAISGFQYALYNLMAAPMILYVARNFKTRKHAISAGIIAAAIAIIPAGIFHVAFSGAEPTTTAADIPVYAMMNAHSMHFLILAFTIMLFGTLIETGAGILQGVNERIDSQLKDYQREPLGKWAHTGVAMGLMVLALLVASVGIIDLIAKGYGTMAWVFFAVYFIPLLTVGVRKLVQTNSA
jgi:uncharacterized membrane protein YkvI